MICNFWTCGSVNLWVFLQYLHYILWGEQTLSCINDILVSLSCKWLFFFNCRTQTLKVMIAMLCSKCFTRLLQFIILYAFHIPSNTENYNFFLKFRLFLFDASNYPLYILDNLAWKNKKQKKNFFSYLIRSEMQMVIYSTMFYLDNSCETHFSALQTSPPPYFANILQLLSDQCQLFQPIPTLFGIRIQKSLQDITSRFFFIAQWFISQDKFTFNFTMQTASTFLLDSWNSSINVYNI